MNLRGRAALRGKPLEERNERLGIFPNKAQLEFQQRYVYGGCYRSETWQEYCNRKRFNF